MNQAQFKKIALKVIVTFVEGGVAYWVASGKLINKTVLAGMVAAGVSAVYNLTRHYTGV